MPFSGRSTISLTLEVVLLQGQTVIKIFHFDFVQTGETTPALNKVFQEIHCTVNRKVTNTQPEQLDSKDYREFESTRADTSAFPTASPILLATAATVKITLNFMSISKQKTLIPASLAVTTQGRQVH